MAVNLPYLPEQIAQSPATWRIMESRTGGVRHPLVAHRRIKKFMHRQAWCLVMDWARGGRGEPWL